MKDSEKIQSHVLEKYQIIKKLGSGAYGHVWKAKSKKTGETYALKKIFDAFQHSTDAQRTFREISILKQLKNDKIIKLEEVIAAENNQDIYLVFQYMQSDLYHLVYEGKLQQIHIKYILYQVLLGLHYLHSSKLMHRDLKPSNILVNSDCTAKICDFGLVRYLGSDLVDVNTLTEGVATRWYRAPQILLGSSTYGIQADMWSIGCVLGQILLKNPLLPGNCTTNQLERIIQLTGQPSSSDIKSIKAELGEVMIAEICNGKVKKRLDLFSKVQDKVAIDLMYKLLQFNPSKRLSAQQALKHQYFSQFFNPSDLAIIPKQIQLEIDQNIRLETKDYLNIIRQKFIKTKQGSAVKQRRKVCQSPKSFSDLKRSRVSSNNKTQSSRVVSRSKNKRQNNSKNLFSQQSQINTANKDTSLFAQLLKQKQQKSAQKKQKRGDSKQNRSIHQNYQIKNEENQKNVRNFQSFNAVNNNIRKYGEQKSYNSFSGLRKTSKLNQK